MSARDVIQDGVGDSLESWVLLYRVYQILEFSDLPKREFHDVMQVYHNVAEVAVDHHDNAKNDKIHRVVVGEDREDETDTSQNDVVVVDDPNENCHCNDLEVVAHVHVEEAVHESCSIATRDNILEEEEAHEKRDDIHHYYCYSSECHYHFAHGIFPAVEAPAAVALDHHAEAADVLPIPVEGSAPAVVEEDDLPILIVFASVACLFFRLYSQIK